MDGLDCSRASLYHLDDLLSTDGLERVIEDFLGRGGRAGGGGGEGGEGGGRGEKVGVRCSISHDDICGVVRSSELFSQGRPRVNED